MSVSLVMVVVSWCAQATAAPKAKQAPEVKAAPATAPPPKVEEKQAAPSKPAEKQRIGLGANVKVGVLVPTNKLGPSVLAGVELRERLPFIRRMLGVAFEFGYFEPRLSGSGTSANVGGDFSYSGSARAFQLAVDALFFLPLELPVDLYAGIGYAAFLYTTTERAFNTSTIEAETRHGVRVRAGVLWPFWGPLYASFEFVYHYAAFGFMITGPVNAGAVNFNLNFGFEL